MEDRSLYGGKDPREIPAYRIPEAAHYLYIPVTTLRAWVLGQRYQTERGRRIFYPVIEIADTDQYLLSFINLVEVHVLAAIRRKHRVPLQKVREALLYLKKRFPSRHPLADQGFETDGLDLFIEKFGQLIAISRQGQLAMRDLVKVHLQRIERDVSGIPIKLYLFPRGNSHMDAPKRIVVDPAISFGRPMIARTCVPTEVVFQRFAAGESVEELADDYGCRAEEIEEAIWCEHHRAAA